MAKTKEAQGTIVGMEEVVESDLEIRDLIDESKLNGLTASFVLMMFGEESNPADELHDVKALLKRGFSEHDVCVVLGISPVELETIQRLDKLPDEFMDAVQEGDIAPGVARKVAAMAPDDRKKATAKFAVGGKLTGKDLHTLREVTRTTTAGAVATGAMFVAKTDEQKQEEIARFVRRMGEVYKISAEECQELVEQKYVELFGGK